MNRCVRLNVFLTSLVYMSCLQFTSSIAYSQTEDYNIKIGDLLLDFSVYGEYSYNDNVTTIPEGVPDQFDPTIIGPRDDYIFGWGADVGINWQITDSNTLSLTLGVKYEDYSELDYLDTQNTFFSVDPDSEVDFKVLIGPFEFNVYDKFGYSVSGSNAALIQVTEDPEGEVDAGGRPILRGRSLSVRVDRYAAWTNEIGVEGLAVLNPLEWTIGLRRYDLMPDDNDSGENVAQLGGTLDTDRWEFTRRSENIIDSQLYYPLGRDNGAGIFGKYTENDYKREILADSNGWQIGAVVDWSLGDRTAFSANVGYNYREYDETLTLHKLPADGGGLADILESKDMFYSFEILNLIGQSLNHKLSFTKSIGLGRVTNEQIISVAAWDFTFEGIRNVDLTGGVQWINADDSGPDQFAEHYDLFMATLGFDIKISSSLNGRVSYRYIDKDSDNNDRDYKQNLVSVSLHYDF
jgi:hypothetical protein